MIKHIGDIADKIVIERHPCAECGKECFGRFCDECEEKAVRGRDERERQVREVHQNQIIQRRIANPTGVIRQMGVPETMQGFTFAGMKDKYPSFQKIKPVRSALTKGLGVLLYPEDKTGTIGNGKTRLAVAGMYHLACQSDMPLDQFGFIDAARWTYIVNNLDKRERDELIDRIIALRYLVIDDAGWEEFEQKFRTEHKEIMRILFRERYNQGNASLITTNLKITGKFNQFAEFYGLDVFDRLKSSCKLIAVAGGSLR